MAQAPGRIAADYRLGIAVVDVDTTDTPTPNPSEWWLATGDGWIPAELIAL